MAKNEKNVANNANVTVDNVEAKIAELNSTSKGLDLAKKKIQERQDEAAATDAMQVLGMSNYANLKALACLRRMRKKTDILKEFLMKTKSLLEVATKENGDEKEHNKEYFEKLSATYKDKDMTTGDFRKEFDDLNSTLKDDFYKVESEYNKATRELMRVLETHGVWSFNCKLDF